MDDNQLSDAAYEERARKMISKIARVLAIGVAVLAVIGFAIWWWLW